MWPQELELGRTHSRSSSSSSSSSSVDASQYTLRYTGYQVGRDIFRLALVGSKRKDTSTRTINRYSPLLLLLLYLWVRVAFVVRGNINTKYEYKVQQRFDV